MVEGHGAHQLSPSHHHHHRHGPHGGAAADERSAFRALLLTAAFMVVEAVGGILAGSLALVADAAHMLTDAIALALVWLAFRVGRRAADPRRSYGYRRLEVLAALFNGLAVVGLAAWIVYEAVRRLAEPAPIEGAVMLVVAALGLGVNVLVLRTLRGAGDQDNLNLRGAILHVVGDLLSSAAALAAALVVLWYGWTPIDPILSIAVAAMILFSGWRLAKSAAHILLEGSPDGFDAAAVGRRLRAVVPAVEDVHHIHAWLLTTGQPLVTLHARIAADAEDEVVLNAIKHELAAGFGMGHSVVQLERGTCPDHAATPARTHPCVDPQPN